MMTNDPGTLSTLARGLAALEVLADSPRPMSALELCDALDIRKGAGYQILRTLKAGGWVVRHSDSSYSLGPTALRIGAKVGDLASPPHEAVEILEALHSELDENLYLTLRQGKSIAIAAHFGGTRAVRVGPLNVGYAQHLHARATTQCVLAYLSSGEVDALLPRELERMTPHTLTDRAGLDRKLAEIRSRGFVTEIEEFSEGVACSSAPVFGGSGAIVGSIGISVPLHRFRANQESLIAAALGGAERISRAFGYKGPYPLAA